MQCDSALHSVFTFILSTKFQVRLLYPISNSASAQK